MTFLVKIVTFVTKKAKAEKLNLQIGQPRREGDLSNVTSVQKYGRGRWGNAKQDQWEGVLKVEKLFLKIAQKFQK